MSTDRTDFYVGQLDKYKGWTINQAVRTPRHLTEDESFFGLELASPDKKKKVVLWIEQDDEGNGPGSFRVEDSK